MKKTRWIAAGACGLALAILACVIAWRALEHASAMHAVREWARVEPLPPAARDVHLETKGSMFTREFILEFTADHATVEAWLTASAGTHGVTPDVTGSVRHYAVKPGGGAEFAEVIVDERTWHVRVRTYWS